MNYIGIKKLHPLGTNKPVKKEQNIIIFVARDNKLITQTNYNLWETSPGENSRKTGALSKLTMVVSWADSEWY